MKICRISNSAGSSCCCRFAIFQLFTCSLDFEACKFDFLRLRNCSDSFIRESSLKVLKGSQVTHMMKANQALPTCKIASGEPKPDFSLCCFMPPVNAIM